MINIITISGPSGTGKSTLEDILTESFGFSRVISTTTRTPRFHEKEGVDYYFLDEAAFLDLMNRRGLIEDTEVAGYYYGVSRHEVERLAEIGKPIVVVCDPKGANQIAFCGHEFDWNVVPVYLNNSIDLLAQRFLKRFRDERDADIGNYSKRLINLFEVEKNWLNAMPQGTVCFDNITWDNIEEVCMAISGCVK